MHRIMAQHARVHEPQILPEHTTEPDGQNMSVYWPRSRAIRLLVTSHGFCADLLGIIKPVWQVIGRGGREFTDSRESAFQAAARDLRKYTFNASMIPVIRHYDATTIHCVANSPVERARRRAHRCPLRVITSQVLVLPDGICSSASLAGYGNITADFAGNGVSMRGLPKL